MFRSPTKAPYCCLYILLHTSCSQRDFCRRRPPNTVNFLFLELSIVFVQLKTFICRSSIIRFTRFDCNCFISYRPLSYMMPSHSPHQRTLTALQSVASPRVSLVVNDLLNSDVWVSNIPRFFSVASMPS